MSKDYLGRRTEDLTGKKIGRLTVMEYAGTNKHRMATYICECSCGNKIVVRGCNLKSGKTKSCGCYQKDTARKSISAYINSDKFTSPDNTIHGMAHSRLYRVWCRMKQRCHNQNKDHYERYGGRGIKICNEWEKDFESFYEWAMSTGYEDGLTIERKDVNGDYCPENCKWATQKEQVRNRTNTLYYEHAGIRKPLAEWCEDMGVKYKLAWERYKKGWSFEAIFEKRGVRV